MKFNLISSMRRNNTQSDSHTPIPKNTGVSKKQKIEKRRNMDKTSKTIEVSKSGISVQTLAHKIGCTSADIIKIMFRMGNSLQINQQIDSSTAKIVWEAKGFNA